MPRTKHLTTILSLLPALGLIAVLFGASVIYGVAQSLGYLPFINQDTLSLAAYRNVLIGPSTAQREFWVSLGFSLWVSITATLLAALLALLIATVLGERLRSSTTNVTLLNLNLAFPHLVWAIGLSLLLAQSGLLARIAAATGLIDTPADFPVLVRDRAGAGIIMHYVTKGTPFLILVLLSIMRTQTEELGMVAENLGATRWQRLRYVTLPLVLPGLTAGSLLLFAFVFGAYEVPAVLGVRFPRMLSVLALDFFINADLRSRAEGMAISVMMALIVLIIAATARYLSERKR